MPKKNKKQKRRRVEAEIERDRFCHSSCRKRPRFAVPADPEALAHNNTYDLLPEWYEDLEFRCVDCGATETWTAAQQKWWYEAVKAHIHSRAIRCSRCRKRRRDEREAQRQHMSKMAELKANAKR